MKEKFEQLRIPHEISELRFDGFRVGDFTDSNHSFLVEHKAKKDCYNSITSDRLVKQLGMMHDHFPGPKYLVIDCTIEQLVEYTINRSLLQGFNPKGLVKRIQSLPTLCSRAEVQFVSTGSFNSSVRFIEGLSRHDPVEPFTYHVRRNIIHDDERVSVLTGINGIGLKGAQTLINTFGSIALLVDALKNDEARVLGVPGIGKKTLTNLKRVLL